ncbi:hypothetical protein [Microbacterium sp. 18062]|uniref:hypothetical protein n=1 Tax=Microbacterium sp. 18062 TaxID=2681410 RepID=UPI00190F2A05|nr:hypothetical protein [Microbacterium sp. 18062]
MTEPQVWTLIAVFATLMFGMLTVVSTLFVRVVRAEIGSVRSEIRGGLDNVNTRIDNVNARIDSLDRDVQALVKHTFGIDRS